MKLIVESTEQIVQVDGVPCRLWTGTCDGAPVHALIHRIAVPTNVDLHRFDQQLSPQDPPKDLRLPPVDPTLFMRSVL